MEICLGHSMRALYLNLKGGMRKTLRINGAISFLLLGDPHNNSCRGIWALCSRRLAIQEMQSCYKSNPANSSYL
jgi:hypothetical protein